MSNKHPYYKCNGTKKRNLRRSGQEACTARMLPAPLIEAAVWADLAWKVRNPSVALEQAKDKLRERQEQTIDHQMRRDGLQKQLTNVEQSNRYLRHQLTHGQFRPGRGPEQIEEDLVATEREIARVQGQLAELDVVLGVTGEMERQYAAAVPLLAQMRDELDAIEAEQDRPKMRLILDKLIQQVTVLDKRARYPDVSVDYAFAVGGNTSTISPVVNIKTVVVIDPTRRVA